MILNTPIGDLTFTFEGKYLQKVFFGKKKFVQERHVLEKEIAQQIKAYFAGKRQSFDVPYTLQGTDFQRKVWRALAKIPYGETVTYQALAEQLKTGARAIGNACRQNPLPVIIPCHRVVAKNSLGGFSGKTKGAMMKIKEYLLVLEKN